MSKEKEITKEQEETIKKDENIEETSENNKSNSEEVNEFEEKYNEINDKYLRLYSEFDNFRRRTAKEKLELMSTAGAEIVSEILPVLDDMERAIASNETAEDIEAVKEGFNLVYHKMKHTLESKGLKEMDVKEKDFDPELSEAITKIPAPNDELKGKVVDVVEKGYYLNDKVIRYAKVVIGE